MEIHIRHVKEGDLAEIVEITNQAIRKRKTVGFTRELTVTERKDWFNEHTMEKYPILVAELNNKITGWTSLSPYRKGRAALDKTAEVSYFIHDDYQRQGIGTALLYEMMQVSQNLGMETLIAIIFHTNRGSIRLLEKNDFKKWGFLPDVGEIDGMKLSHVFYGKKILQQ